jgi:hypothetical protein
MFNIKNFFGQGLKNSVLMKNNSGFSHSGPWQLVNASNAMDRWHVGDFSAVEYTISVDLDTSNKEILKCLVTASRNDAQLVVYARSFTNTQLVNMSAVVNNSYVDIIIKPESTKKAASKFIFTANYFQNQNPLVP